MRIIHDATHEVMISHRIRVRDRMRFPEARSRTAFSLEKAEEVFMHTVGAFGFGLAYSWQRVAAAVTRLAHMFAGTYELYHLGADCWRRILYWFFVMDVVEVPITWPGWVGSATRLTFSANYLKGIGASKEMGLYSIGFSRCQRSVAGRRMGVLRGPLNL